MKASDLVKSSAFMMTLSVVVALVFNFGGFFPGDVLNTDVRPKLTVIVLALMLTISFSRIPFKNLNPVTNWKSVIRAFVLGLVVSSVIPLIGYWLLKDTEFGGQAMGLVFIAATPFAASVVPLSYVLNGDMEHASRGTIVVYFLSLLWIPFIVWLALRDVVDMMNVLITVIELIPIPLLLSRVIRNVKINKDYMAMFLNCCIFFLVWLSVGSTNFKGMTAAICAAFVIIAALRTFGLGNAVEIAEKRSGIHWSQRVTDILMTSYKNKGIAITLCTTLLAGPMIGTAMVAIATSIVVEVLWVAFMDSVLFNRKRMERELAAEQASAE